MSNETIKETLADMENTLSPLFKAYCSKHERVVCFPELYNQFMTQCRELKLRCKERFDKGYSPYHEYHWVNLKQQFQGRFANNFLVKNNGFYYEKIKKEKEELKKEQVFEKRKREENVEVLLGEIRDLLMEMNEPSQKRLREAMSELNI